MGVVRLYIEPRLDLPEGLRPPEHIPVIDVAPEHVSALRKQLRRRGYEVHAFPI